MKKLFVGNLEWGITNDDLAEIFAKFGEVTEAIVIQNDRGQSKGFGFVTFADPAAADAAIEGLDGQEVNGRKVGVSEARSREDRPQR